MLMIGPSGDFFIHNVALTHPADLIWLQNLVVMKTKSFPVSARGRKMSCSRRITSLVGWLMSKLQYDKYNKTDYPNTAYHVNIVAV